MLGSAAQFDFSAGEWQAVARHLIPERGAFRLLNFLLDEDGSPYRRGGSEYLSTAAFGTSLRFLWEGQLGPGPRSVIANPDDFGVLDAAEAPVNLGGSGLAAPRRAVELAGVLHIGGGTIYGGSRKTADYSTGTISTTQGSKTVTGSGTTWNTLVDAGMLLKIGSERPYPVESIDSTTQLTLRDPYEGSTGAGKAYALKVLETAARVSELYAVAGGRLWSLEGARAYFTEPGNPHVFDAVEGFHEVAEGSQFIGGAGLENRLLGFTTSGLWVISNLAFDLTDEAGNSQHEVQHQGEQLILWSHEGIAFYSNALVAPCADHVWLVDGVSSPVPLTASIAGRYRSYVAAGHKTGLGAVIRSHYLLPILNQSNGIVDVLVCRLDRPYRSPVGTAYPWTRLGDFSGDVAGFAVRTGSGALARNPQLLAASMRSSARVLNCNGFFGPDVEQKQEPDGSVHETDLISRDYATGDGRTENTVRRVRVRYELVDADSDDPAISGYWSDGSTDLAGISLWDEMDWGDDWAEADAGEFRQLAGQAPEDDGREPFPWPVNKRVRFIRFRFRSFDPAAKLVYRTLELLIRPTGKR